MPYKFPVDLRAKLDALAVETKAAKQEARERQREVTNERRPLAEQVRSLKRNLERTEAARHKMQFGGYCRDHSERETESLYGQRWRDTLARIATLKAQLLDAELRLAFFDQEHNT